MTFEEELLKTGFRLYNQGKFKDALECFQNVLTIDRSNEKALEGKKLAEEKFLTSEEPPSNWFTFGLYFVITGCFLYFIGLCASLSLTVNVEYIYEYYAILSLIYVLMAVAPLLCFIGLAMMIYGVNDKIESSLVLLRKRGQIK